MQAVKVLQVFKDFYPPVRGGIEHHIHDIAGSLPGFESTVLTSSRGLRTVIENRDGVRVIQAAEIARIVSAPIVPRWLPMLHDTDADVIHMHMPNPFAELCLLVARPSAPVVVTYHADVERARVPAAVYARLQARVLRLAVRIVVSSPNLAATSPTLAAHLDRVAVVPFGIDPLRWRVPAEEVEAVRRRHRPPIVLFLGRLRHYKGVEILIEAMRTAEATLVVCGDGPMRAELERRAARTRLRRMPVFSGDVDDDTRRAYLAAADIFVLPSTSRAESFGIAMLEAMACGRPVISTELGTGTSWVNVHGRTGIVVPPRRPAELAEAIGSLLADDALRRAMGEAARRRARDDFPRDRMLEEIASIYRSARAVRSSTGRSGRRR